MLVKSGIGSAVAIMSKILINFFDSYLFVCCVQCNFKRLESLLCVMQITRGKAFTTMEKMQRQMFWYFKLKL